VFLLEPEPTPYDLRFRLFDVPVRVHPMFWVFTAILGWNFWNDYGFPYLALWVGCVFASVLLHEMGHVLMGRAFGTRGHIVLYTFGGLATGSTDLRRRWQRIAVLAAGPLAQLVLLVPIWAVAGGVVPKIHPFLPPTTTELALSMLWRINLWWPLLNLLPVWPLDGGQISREALEGGLGARGVQAALILSIGVSGLLAAHALLYETNKQLLLPFVGPLGMYTALLFLSLAMSSFQALQAEKARREHWHDRLPWEE
jgi:stage IV sporulation protein FB